MKKSLLFFITNLIAIVMVNAQKVDASKVPTAVKSAYMKEYPGVKNVKWEIENAKYEANFKKDGQSMSAVFDKSGKMIESEVDIKISELPADVVPYIKQHYKGAAIKEAAKITKAGGEVNYEAEVNHKDVIFDANGKFIKEEKE